MDSLELMKRILIHLLTVGWCLSLSVGPLSHSGRAEEGMWLFNDPPKKAIQEAYGYEVTDAWLQKLMRASIRFNSGGSGSFVSEDGLVISNHHVGADALYKLSREDRDLMVEGYLAGALDQELPCFDLELNVLQAIQDVTDQVNAAVPEGASPEDAFAARRRVMADIEEASLKETGLRSDVVTLFQGGAYHLYQFKRYTDVRLVFAPEQQIAYFGGDADNFEYPRYCLDFCLFRVYEDGQPAKTPDYLKWSANGPDEGELTFVSGHPGRTSRLLTVAELEAVRDIVLPARLNRLKQLEVLLSAWSARHPENARRAKDDLFGVQNARKAFDGALAGLLDPEFFAARVDQETALRIWLRSNSGQEDAGAAHERIAVAQLELNRISQRYGLLERGVGLGGDLFGIARTLLRAGDELAKPSGERLREFGEGGLESLKLRLFSEKPIYADLEILKLTDSLTYLASQLGVGDRVVQQILNGKSPAARAAELILNTRVGDVSIRRSLFEGGAKAVSGSADPMIELARLVDLESRTLRSVEETQTEIKRQAHGALARARWERDQAGGYPDATFTLRFTYGQIRGYEFQGQKYPAWTQVSGLFERGKLMDYQGAFALPPSWEKAQDLLPTTLPANFVSTHDIIGGNSGSPVVNRAGEFVGIIFDGNIQSLVFDYAYDDVVARAISVHSTYIKETLRRVYNAESLVRELESGRRAL